METGKIVSSHTTWTFAWAEFLDKLGLPRDADVIQVRVDFTGGGSFAVVAKDGA